MGDHSSKALGFDDRTTDGAPFLVGRLGHHHKRLRPASAVVCLLGWLLACGDNTSTPSGDAATDATGGGDTTTGGDAGGGGDSARQDTGSMADAGGSDGAGDDGSTDAAVPETAPPPSLCDGMPKKPLPYTALADFTQVTIIGPEMINLTQILPADCNATTFPPIPPPNVPPDGGEAGASEAGADAAATSDATVDAGATADASTEGGGEASTDATASLPACYEFLYNPSCLLSPTTGALCWAGVIFQSPGSNPNTGGGTGICIELGATTITFSARASRDQARIKFGSTRPGLGTTEFFLNVTTAWQTYTISIPPGEPYNDEIPGTAGVWNGFSAVVEPEDHIGDGSPGDVGTYILIKDVVWSIGD